MSFTMPEIADTRARMIRAYRSALEALIEDATQRPGDVRDENNELAMVLADWDGVPVVTRKRLDEAVSAIFGQSIPAPSETTVEVSTPATVLTWVSCPRCHIAQLMSVSIRGELLTDDDGSEMHAKAKSKGVSHTCGQLPLSVVDDEDEDLTQTGLMEAIESLVERVHGMLVEVAALPGEEDAEEMPSLETIASWDRATIDQVDAWAAAVLANVLPDEVPPLPRVLGGEADPEPAIDANDVDFGEGAPNAEEVDARETADEDDAEPESDDDLLPA